MRFHLDTDFFVVALSEAGPERARLLELADSRARLAMSAVAWYEFSRGPRTAAQLAVARSFLLPEGIRAFDEELAAHAGETFRALGSPRRRAADIAIGVTAAADDAVLLTRNGPDFEGIPHLRIEAPGSDP